MVVATVSAWVITGVLAYIMVMIFSEGRRRIARAYPLVYRVGITFLSILAWPLVVLYAWKGKNGS